MKPSIVIIGAGSVEFTRELLGDILSFPELGGVHFLAGEMSPGLSHVVVLRLAQQ